MIPRSQPDPTQDLFEIYSLNDVAESVARVLRNGEKNALRKTYKGHIKKLGVSGKFDVKTNSLPPGTGSLAVMVNMPEEEWSVQNVRGKEIEKGLPELSRSSLAKAMIMAKSSIPKTRWDSSVLGDLDLPDKKAPLSNTVPAKPNVLAHTNTAAQNIAGQRPSKVDVARPKRNVKKRHYEDSSFEGYGEGYVDDEAPDTGYSTGDGEDRGTAPKRRKKAATGSFTSMGPARHNSYGPGMIGT